MDNELTTSEITEPSIGLLADYWRYLEDYNFPLSKETHVYYSLSFAIGNIYRVTITVVDKRAWLFPYDIAATQYIFKLKNSDDYTAMRIARQWAQEWLLSTLAPEQENTIRKSLPLLEE